MQNWIQPRVYLSVVLAHSHSLTHSNTLNSSLAVDNMTAGINLQYDCLLKPTNSGRV